LHAVHAKDYKDFSRDLGKISRRFSVKVYGFAKHGFKVEKIFIYIGGCPPIAQQQIGLQLQNAETACS